MENSSVRWLYWTPRVLGVLVALFIGLFSFDVFEMGLGFWGTVLALLAHLIPTIVLLLAALLPRRWGWLSGLLFLGWAVFYPLRFGGFEPFVYLILSGIPAVVGVLFLADWWRRRKSAQQAQPPQAADVSTSKDDELSERLPPVEPQSALEKRFIQEYLESKGYHWDKLAALPAAQVKELMVAASRYASLKLAELESRKQFKDEIKFDG